MKKKKVLVIGLGRFGLNIAKSLADLGTDVLGVDIESSRVEIASEFLPYCEICDTSRIDVLEEINASSYDCAIVSIGNLQSTFLTVANLSELKIKKIVVRLESNEYENVVKKLGATDIVIPEIACANSLAHEILSNSILDYYQIDEDYGVVQVAIKSHFKPQTLIELDLRNKYDVNIVGILRNKKFFIPKGTDTINPLDTILVVGRDKNIAKLEEINE